MTAVRLYQKEKWLAAIFLLLAVLLPYGMRKEPATKLTVSTKTGLETRSTLAPNSPLRVNELGLGMTRSQLDKTPSMIDGRTLPHHSLDGLAFEGYGFAQGGINTCEFVTFSADDCVVGIEGYRLFLHGKQLQPSGERGIKELGAPTKIEHRKDGETVVFYNNYSLAISFYEDKEYVYTLGQSKR